MRCDSRNQFGLSCARVKRVSLDERLNAVRRVRDEIYKNALVQVALARGQEISLV